MMCLPRLALAGCLLVLELPALPQATTPDEDLATASLPALRTKLETAQEELRALRTAGIPAERRAAEEPSLQEWAQALRDYVELRERCELLDVSTRRATESAETARTSVTQAQLELEKLVAPEELSEEQYRALEAAERLRRSDTQRAEAAFAAARDRLDGHEARIPALPEEIAERRRVLAEARQRLEDPQLQLAERRRIERQRDASEARALQLELQRDRQAELRTLAQAELEASRAALDLCRALEALEKRRLDLAKGTRDRLLEESARRARAEAEQKEREAQRRANQPAYRGVARLESLTARQRGLATEEQRQDNELSTLRHTAEEQEQRIAIRNRLVTERVSANTQLDPLRQAFLRDQIRLLERRRESFEDWARPLESMLDLRELELHQLVDQLLYLQEIASLSAEWITAGEVGLDNEPGERTEDSDAELLITATRDFLQGRRALAEEGRGDELEPIQSRWNAAHTELIRSIEARRTTQDRLQLAIPAVRGSIERTRLLLGEREAHLERVRFWLKEAPPLSGAELGSAAAEMASWRELLAAAPPVLIDRLGRMFEEAPLALSVLAALGIAGICFWLLAQRSHARMAEESPSKHDALGRLARLLRHARRRGSGLALLVLTSAIASRVVLREDALLHVLFLGLAGYASYRALIVSTKSLFGPATFLGMQQPGTAARAQRLVRVAATGFLVLLPLRIHLGFLGLERLVTLTEILTSAWGLALGIWLLFRRDVLGLIGAGDGSQRTSAWLRLAVLFLWPLLVLVFAATLSLQLLGYGAASAYYTRRSLLSLAALLTLRICFELLRAWILRRTSSDEEERDVDTDDDEHEQERRLLLRRAGLFVLSAATLAVAGPLTLFALGLELESVRAALRWIVVPGREEGGGTSLGSIMGALFLLGAGIAVASLLRTAFRVGRRSWNQGSRYAAGTLIAYGVILACTLVALRLLGIYLEELGWLLAPAGVAIGFGLTEILSNFVSGLILFIERPVQVGDVVSVGNIQGDVESISIRSTTVRTRDGISIILPNKQLITDHVTNWSHGEQRTRLHIPFSVAYGSDVALVKRVTIEVAGRDSRLLKRPRPEVSFLGFGESELEFELLVWLPTPDVSLHRRVLSDLNSAIDAAFRRAHIEIPFPQRDLHVRSMPAGARAPHPDDDAE